MASWASGIAAITDDAPFGSGFADQTLRRVPYMRRVFRVADYDPGAGLRSDQLDQLGEEIAIVRIRLER